MYFLFFEALSILTKKSASKSSRIFLFLKSHIHCSLSTSKNFLSFTLCGLYTSSVSCHLFKYRSVGFRRIEKSNSIPTSSIFFSPTSKLFFRYRRLLLLGRSLNGCFVCILVFFFFSFLLSFNSRCQILIKGISKIFFNLSIFKSGLFLLLFTLSNYRRRSSLSLRILKRIVSFKIGISKSILYIIKDPTNLSLRFLISVVLKQFTSTFQGISELTKLSLLLVNHKLLFITEDIFRPLKVKNILTFMIQFLNIKTEIIEISSRKNSILFTNVAHKLIHLTKRSNSSTTLMLQVLYTRFMSIPLFRSKSKILLFLGKLEILFRDCAINVCNTFIDSLGGFCKVSTSFGESIRDSIISTGAKSSVYFFLLINFISSNAGLRKKHTICRMITSSDLSIQSFLSFLFIIQELSMLSIKLSSSGFLIFSQSSLSCNLIKLLKLGKKRSFLLIPLLFKSCFFFVCIFFPKLMLNTLSFSSFKKRHKFFCFFFVTKILNLTKGRTSVFRSSSSIRISSTTTEITKKDFFLNIRNISTIKNLLLTSHKTRSVLRETFHLSVVFSTLSSSYQVMNPGTFFKHTAKFINLSFFFCPFEIKRFSVRKTRIPVEFKRRHRKSTILSFTTRVEFIPFLLLSVTQTNLSSTSFLFEFLVFV